MGPEPWHPEFLLWDLDGTIAYWRTLRVVGEIALRYLHLLRREAPLLPALLGGARAFRRMLHNPGGMTNDALYNRLLSRSIGLAPERLAAITRDMIEEGHLDDLLARSFRPIPEGLHLVEDLARQGRYRQVVATSPAMPASFNRRRLEQAGFAPDWFLHVTGSDLYTSHKRERRFYDELLSHLGTTADRCLMVGNDLGKDLYCRLAGIPMFLIENAWLHREKQPPGLEPNWSGSYDRLREGLEQGFPPPATTFPAVPPSGGPA